MGLERLDKILSHMGICSRREAAKLAKSGAIRINGGICRDSGCKVDPAADDIAVDGETICYKTHVYILMNKAAGYITATEDRRQPTVLALLGEREQKMGLFAAGRLDKDTEGLLLLTNDGAFAHSIMSPKHRVEKSYLARVEGTLAKDAEERFAAGLQLEDGTVCLPAGLRHLAAPDEILVTICEGKYHQVKRMVEQCGGRVRYLKRLSIGGLTLPEELSPGDWRYVDYTWVKTQINNTDSKTIG